MTDWGIEYLDTEWYYDPPPAPEPLPQPWRQHPLAGACFLFPRLLLLDLAQGPRLVQVRRDAEAIASIRRDILAHGLREPLELIIDRDGRIVLRDGHHRLVAVAGIAELEMLPAFVSRSDTGIAVPCSSTADVLADLLRGARAA